MNDVRTLIKNRLRAALQQLESEEVGHIDCEDYTGFRYFVDGRFFHICAREIGVSDDQQ